MANPKQAIDFVIRQEDESLSGVITDIAGDNGGMTRFGLTSKYHPDLITCGFFYPKMSAHNALILAEQTYDLEYTGMLCLAEITDQAIATALLSFSVNDGTPQGVRLLQRAVTNCGVPVTEDGVMGPATVAAVNNVQPQLLLATYCGLQGQFYGKIVANNPSQGKFLKGWMSRVAAVDSLAV